MHSLGGELVILGVFGCFVCTALFRRAAGQHHTYFFAVGITPILLGGMSFFAGLKLIGEVIYVVGIGPQCLGALVA